MCDFFKKLISKTLVDIVVMGFRCCEGGNKSSNVKILVFSLKIFIKNNKLVFNCWLLFI